MRVSRFHRRATGTAGPGRPTTALGARRWRVRAGAGVMIGVVAIVLQWALAVLVPALAATPLNVFVGYMDTHSVASSSKQPRPWPYTDPSSYVGSPCPSYPTSTTCWDAAALRLDNPGGVDVTGVHVVVVIGSSTYNLWGSSLTVKAGGTLVLTETGGQNSTNFDGSDFSPNSYNGGNTASCVNSGAVPDVRITIGATTTSYLDSGQVLNGGGVDSGHCVNGSFVSGRIDESHPWSQIGVAASTTPSAPQGLVAVAGDASVNLSWAAPASDGGSGITGYNVYRGTSPGGESPTPVATNVATTSFTDSGRANGTTYYYTVAAVNAVGASTRSNEASGTPQAAQPTAPSAPTGLSAVGGNASVALSWTAPASNGGSPITGYSVYRGSTAGGESPTPIATNVTGTSFTDTGEVNGTPYYYKVAAVNAVGTSPQSNEASATPRATVASAPTGLVASAGDASVALSWQMPTSDGGSGITGYNVYRGTSAGAEGSIPIAANVAMTSFTDSSVTNGTPYFYRVAAVNAVGTSPFSAEASATPRATATPPSAPQSLAAVGSNTTVALSWSAPASNGGSAITGYTVYRGTSAGGEAATPVAANVAGTSFTDTGLANGTTYFYTVAAVNAAGTSPASAEASGTPQATAPSAPIGLTAAAANGSVALTWSAPASNGGSPVTGYNVYRGTSAGAEGTTPVASGVATTSFADTGVTNGTAYFYRVAAVNAVGTSAWSAEASGTPQAAATAGYVGRVGSLTASTARTTSTVTVGSAGVVAGHAVVVSLLLSSTSLTGAVSVTDSGGNTYTVVRDVNDGSAGDRVVTAVAFAVRALPAGATVTMTYASAGQTHAAVDELAGVTGVDVSAGATGTGTAFSSGSSSTSAAGELLLGVAGLESSSAAPSWATGWTALPTLSVSTDRLATAYRTTSTVGAYAASGTGGGQWMAALIAFRAASGPQTTVPSAPLSLAATGGTGTVSLSWSVPASNGGSAITGYNVYRGTSAGGEGPTPVASNVAGTSFTDALVTNGTAYFYQVAAVNAVGTSARSNEASATPQAAATVPSAPLSLGATGGNASVALTWSAPASNGGSAVTGYNVYRGTSAGSEASTPVASNLAGTGFTDTSVTNGTAYFYQVAAVNAVGTSARSNEASATPQAAATVPSAPQSLTAVGGNASVALSWSAPASNGGSAVTGYNVYRGTSAGGEGPTPIASNVAGTSLTDALVTNGTAYFYQVAAVNAVGTSARSSEASATPQAAATVPSAPLSLAATGGTGTVSLSWSAPASNGGSAITGYNVYRGTSAGGEGPTPIASNVAGTSLTDALVTNGTAYFYQVAAVNAVGTSARSSEASATPQAAAAMPSAPQSLTAVGGNASVALSWSAPASNGGSAITGYNVYRGTGAGAEGTTPVASNVAGTGFTDTSLTNGTPYFYRVAAVNAVGTSPMSAEASATPQAASTAGYVGRVGSLTVSTARTTSTVTVGSTGVSAGHTVVVSLLLSSTSLTGAVSVTDSGGNTYAVVRDVNDGSAGDRVVTAVSVRVRALPAGATVTMTYPSAAETHAVVDELAGVSGVDVSAGATGTGTAFGSGSASTSGAGEVLFGVAGLESSSATPVWASGWTALPTLSVSTDRLATAYRIAAVVGSFAASGTGGGQWMAALIAFRTG